MRYKVLGYVVWQAGRWYARRRYGHLVPSRRLATVGVVALVVSGSALLASRRSGDQGS